MELFRNGLKLHNFGHFQGENYLNLAKLRYKWPIRELTLVTVELCAQRTLCVRTNT